jgi:putative toxin-antitoxin system antitoxin component (TIGR02293 family)
MKNTVLGTTPTEVIGGQHSAAQPSNRFIATVREVNTSIPDSPSSEVKFISQVRSGLLPAEAQHQMRELAAKLNLTVREIAIILATPERSYARRLVKAGDGIPPLTKVQAERLLLLQAVAAHGLAVFEDQGKFNRWLRRPLKLLQDQSPLQLLDTVTGFRLIDQVLGRMEYGVYS